jgi:hypothetical protein
MVLSWLTVVMSAFLFTIPFFAASYVGWLSCFSLIPLFYEAFHSRLTLFKGLVWGSAIIFLHSGLVLYSAFLLSNMSLLAKGSIAGAIMLYAGLHAALLWWLSNKLCSYLICYLPLRGDLIRLMVWVTAFWLFFVWLGSCFFWIFIRCEGYALISPVVPLAEYAPVLRLVDVFGYRGLLATLLFWQALAGLILTRPTFSAGFIWFLLTFVCIIKGLSCLPNRAPPDWLSRVAHLPRSVMQDVCCSRAAKTMYMYIAALAEHDHDITTIVIPEDGFQTTRLCSPRISACCIPTREQRPIQVFMSSYRMDNEQQYNTLYWFYNGCLITYFDKRHTMIFTEKTPSVLGVSVLSFFDTDSTSFSAGDNKRPIFEIAPYHNMTPYLCSELFFNEVPDDEHEGIPIFAFCSDKWAHAHYVKNLMYLLVRLRAAQWRRDILYISYEYGVYVTKEGGVYPLKNFSHLLQKVDNFITQQQAALEKTMQRNADTYSALEQHSVKNLGNVLGSYCMSLLLTQQASYNGFSFFLTNPYTHEEVVIKIVINYERSAQENIIHVYLLSDFEIYYLDAITTPTTTHSLSVAIEPDGTVYLEDPTQDQVIIASRFR